MDITLHQNGWTPILNNFDVNHASDQDIKTIAKLLYTNTLVVIKNQNLTTENEINFINKFGKSLQWDPARSSQFFASDQDCGLLRVTGDKEKIGLFPDAQELDWHCNRASLPDKKDIVYLYGVKNTIGSRTSFINLSLVYHDLHPIVKKEIETAKLRLFNMRELDFLNGYKSGIDRRTLIGEGIEISNNLLPMVYTNRLGVKGLYWPSRFVYCIDGWEHDRSEHMITTLENAVFQEKYMYHHDWSDGDILLSEQWLGLHKRWAFPAIHLRLLHRSEFDSTNVVF